MLKREPKLQRAVNTIELAGGYMGAAEVAEALGVQVPNLKWQPIEPIARISKDRIPLYLTADVNEIRARARRAAGAE